MPKKKDPNDSTPALSPEQAPQIVRANVARAVVLSPTFVSLYANDTQIQTSPWDFRLIFGEISNIPTTEEPTVVIRQTGEVRMSPQHAKKVAEILIKQLRHYEETVGPIPLPGD